MHAVTAWCARLPGESQVDRLLRLFTALLVLFFPAACLLVDRSDSTSLLLLGLIGLWVWTRNAFRSGFSRSDWLFVAAFAGFFLVAVVAFEFGHQTDEGFRLLGRYLRLLFALPVLLVLRRYPPPAVAVWGGLGLGALFLGLDAVWESLDAHGFLRPDGDTNVAILFGDLATLTTFAFAAGYVYIDDRLPRLGPFLVFGCVLMGLLASFLSGTRGAWLAMPVILMLFVFCRHLLPTRILLAGAGMTALLFAVLMAIPQMRMLQRIESTGLQLKAYWAISHEGANVGAAPQCMDDTRILQAWVNTEVGDYPAGFSLTVEPVAAADARVLAANGCGRSLAVHMHNAARQVAWAQFRHYEFPGNDPSTALLLVKGHAYVKYGMQIGGALRVGTPVFGLMAMHAPAHQGYALRIVLLPGDDFWFLPVEGRFGGYRYAVLSSPVAQRLAMWAAALRLFGDARYLGVGTGAYQAETQKLVEAGRAAPDTADYDHPHSDYFDALASRGLLGLLSLFALLGVPAWLYARRLESRDPHRMGAALAGLLVTAGFAVFGLTETMFIHSVTIGWYVIMTAVFLVSTEAPQGRDTGKR